MRSPNDSARHGAATAYAPGTGYGSDPLLEQLREGLGDFYAIERELGGGGMSRVFLATERSLERKVVIKVLPPEMVSGVSSSRFQREILVTANLQHPHVLPVLAAGACGPVQYYVAPFIEGQSLRERLTFDGALPVDDGVQILRELAGALAHAHERGVIHRDVKPENVLLSQGHAVLADFGIARAIQQMAQSERLTRTGMSSGTPGYMAPEQLVDGSGADARADVFALGVVAYEMFSGRSPFGGGTPHEVAASYFADPPPALGELRPDLPSTIVVAVTRAISTDPGARFATAGDFLAAIRYSTGDFERVAAAPFSRARLAGAALVIVTAIVAGFALAGRLAARPAEEATAERKVLAVLPFKNLGDVDDAYFASGVTEEVTSRLATLGGLAVISRTSADQYATSDKPLRAIANELGADYVLEGSVRWQRGPRGRGRVRVTPQLIRVSDDTHLWVEQFDAELQDVFTVQSQIAENVAGALAVALPGARRRQLDGPPTRNLAAYEAYVRGEHLRVHESSNPVALARAEGLLREATTLDPAFALAFARLALLHARAYELFVDRSDKRLAAARAAADSAIALDPELPEAHLALGHYFEQAGDPERTAQEYARAEEGRPNDADILVSNASVLARRGAWDEAVRRFREAAKLNPRSPQANLAAAVAFAVTRDYRAARSHADRAIAADSDLVDAYTLRARIDLLVGGDFERARDAVRDMLRRFGPARVVATDGFDLLLPALGDAELAQLERVSVDDLGGQRLIYYFWRTQLYERWHRDRARAYADSLKGLGDRLITSQPTSWRVFAGAGWLNAVVGDTATALAHARRSLELAPRDRDALSWGDAAAAAVGTYVRTGRHDDAVALLEQLLRSPSWVSARYLARDSIYAPLRASPRFQRLVR